MKILNKIFTGTKKWYDTLFFASLLSAVFLVPLLFSFSLKSVFALPKLYALAILLSIAVVSLSVKYFKEGSLNLRAGKFNILLGTYTVLLILSTFLSVNFYTSLFGTYGIFIGLFSLISFLLLTFLIFNFVREKEGQIRILAGAYVGSIVIVTLGILQHMGYLLDSSELTAVASRAFSTLGHANHFGGFIVQFIFVSLALFAILKNKFLRAGIIVLNVFYLYALFQTSSRGAFLALAVTALIACVLILKLFWKEHNEIVGFASLSHKASFAPCVKVKKILVALIAVMVLISISGLIFKEKLKNIEVVERTIGTLEFIEEGNVPDRLSWVLSGIDMIQTRPIFGFGVSTFRDVYNRFRRLDYRSPGDEQDLIVPETAHNEYINTGATQGIPALVVWLAIIFYVLRGVYKTAFSDEVRKTSYADSLCLIFMACAIISYMVQVAFNFGTVGTSVPFYILLGLALGYAFTLKNPDSGIMVKGYAVLATIFLIVLFAGVNLYSYHRVIRADRFLRLADILHTHPDFEKEGYIYHIDALTQATALNPYAYNLYEELGAYYLKQALRIAEYKQTENLLLMALSAYDKAASLNDLHADTYKDIATVRSYLVEVYEQVGLIDKANEQKEKAYTAYEHSIALSPNNPLHRILAADKYMQLGNYERALELYQEVKAMRPEYQDIEKKLTEARGRLN